MPQPFDPRAAQFDVAPATSAFTIASSTASAAAANNAEIWSLFTIVTAVVGAPLLP